MSSSPIQNDAHAGPAVPVAILSRSEPRRGVVAGSHAGPSLFWPVAVATTAFLAWTSFQTVQLVTEAGALSANHAQQEALVQNATKLRQSLDAIAAQTQRLADQGNPNARGLVDELRKRGVTINAVGTTPTK